MKKYIIQIIILTLAISITSIYYEIKIKEVKKQSYWEGVAKQFEEERYLDSKENAKKGANFPLSKVSCHQLSTNNHLNELLKQNFPECEISKVIYGIGQAESSGRQLAINKKNRNGSWDCGFLQVNTVHRKKGESKDQFCNRMLNLEENIKTARYVYDKQGLTAWVTYNNGAYLTYLK